MEIRPSVWSFPQFAGGRSSSAGVDRYQGSTAEERIASVLRQKGKPYYDAGSDARTQREYYSGLGDFARLSPQERFRRLSSLVEDTHTHHCAYEPREYLYEWVDLRPNLRLQCIYDPVPVAADAPVRGLPQDFEEKVQVGMRPATTVVKQKKKGKKKKLVKVPAKPIYEVRSIKDQADSWARALSQAPMNALELSFKIAMLETKSFFNCEHVIPRHWFDDRQPMRGDLHHLFTANQQTNNDRSSRRLVDFPEYDGSDGKGFAPFEDERYEPAAGQGEVARATLYFLLRYPRKVGGGEGEIKPEDLATLLEWNRRCPPTLHEKHRNVAIQDAQGNRNPFIDHPEWADQIDWGLSLGHPHFSRRG